MSNQPPAASTEQPSRLATGVSGTFARVVVCVVVLLVPAMIALICYRSYRVHEPSTAVVIVGDSSIDGALVVVAEEPDAKHPASGPPRLWQIPLDRENGWQTPVLLDPGNYRVTVSYRGHEILNEPFALTQRSGFRFDPMARVSVLAPPDTGNIHVRITPAYNPVAAAPVETDLTESNHYRTSVFLYPGMYRAVARLDTGSRKVVADETFLVDRSGTCRVDLTKPLEAEDAAP